MHIPCQTLTALLLGLALAVATGCTKKTAGSPFISEASRALAAEFATSEEGIETLRVRARTVAVRLHTDASAGELVSLRAELELTTRALAALDGSVGFPWKEWIEESRFILPEWTEQELLCATHLLPPAEAMALCRSCDFREMPSRPRLVAHHTFWRIDPNEAVARGRNLLFREHPRARDLMRRLYVEEVLIPLSDPQVEEMLLDIATEESMEALARSLAVRSLRKRGSHEAPAILESLFDTEATNFLLRKEALLAILELDPVRGHSMLLDKMPARNVDPGTWEFMRALRLREGLPLPTEE